MRRNKRIYENEFYGTMSMLNMKLERSRRRMGIYLDLIRKCKIFVADPDGGAA